ncbi:histidine phosphatase family protein [Mesorhizobium sp. CGMCC 1.15528]|uniref:Histidine phosphatase family protein n=1 Tax=Mesorhizobium zhangyense TaxID=1776730 RepID=A0A7C9R4Q3_9HYPH|nr:histidine phosphatase family protein [Mesorhizobium zhangyense]NGN39478.1 histidine phosphatase family protein [Mesorhizobium zhangyense]
MQKFFIALFLLFSLSPAQATEAGWALLRDGGHVVLLRHAMTPGTGEPTNFDIEKCGTQRNLSDRGKQQARKIGALFAARADTTDRVLSSRYCNALETARLAFGDRIVEPFAALDRPAPDGSTLKAQDEAVMQEIRSYSGSGNLILVTHVENITALTGGPSREGEAVIVRPEGEGLHILGRIVFN